MAREAAVRAESGREGAAPIEEIKVSAYRVPTEWQPESDGTIEWTHTTLVLAEARAAGITGLGYTYADTATAALVRDVLAEVVRGQDAFSINACWTAMVSAVRNLGRPGIASMAIAAVDNALWDLKARLLHLPLVSLLGKARDAIPAYGSGGFTSYTPAQLQQQMRGWAEAGLRRVKMKVGRDPAADVERVRLARQAIGDRVELFVDANGAYTRKQALEFAQEFRDLGVTWFEEPVSSDDLEGLRLIRDRAPAGMNIAAGEYGYDLTYFQRILQAGAVDVLQADASRCAGITEFMRVGALCRAHHVPLSAHTAPSLHAHVCCAISEACHVEYFYDHQRIEQMFFEGALRPVNGDLVPDPSRPGMGLEFKQENAAKYAV